MSFAKWLGIVALLAGLMWLFNNKVGQVASQCSSGCG